MLRKSNISISLILIALSSTGIIYGQVVYQDLISTDGTVVGHALLDYIEEEDITVCLMDYCDVELAEEYVVLLFDCDEYGAITNYIELYGFGRIGRAVARILYVTEGDFSNWYVAVGEVDENGLLVPLWSKNDISQLKKLFPNNPTAQISTGDALVYLSDNPDGSTDTNNYGVKAPKTRVRKQMQDIK